MPLIYKGSVAYNTVIGPAPVSRTHYITQAAVPTSFIWKENNAKDVPKYAREALGGEKCSSYSFSTSALDGGEW
jgi:hypothetical protein